MSHQYYSSFCEYIKANKPDIIGHFDLITKFDELDTSLFLENKAYNEIAEKYLKQIVTDDCIFEVNTGAVARGIRKSYYPYENLLYIIKSNGAKVILSSDSHVASTLDFGFEDAKRQLKDIGFKKACTLFDGKFCEYTL